jgi:hypothetical protein
MEMPAPDLVGSRNLQHLCVVLLLGGSLAVSSASAQQEAPGTQAAPTQRETTGEVVLQADTPIRLRLAEAVTSKKAKVGDRVEFQVMDDVTVGSMVVIPRHAIAWGTVSQAQPSRMLGRGGKLVIALDSVAALTGEQVGLRAGQAEKGAFGIGEMDVAIATASVVLLPALPFVKGDQAVIRKGTMLTAFVKSRVTLAQARLASENRALEERLKSQPPRVPGKAVVSIYRLALPEDDTIKVYLDGKELVRLRQGRFITIELEPGEHAFAYEEDELKLRFEKDTEYYVKADYVMADWYGYSFPKPLLEVVSFQKGDLEMFPLAMSNRRDIKNRALVVVESPPQRAPEP